MPSLGYAADHEKEDWTRHEQPESSSQADLIQKAVLTRALIMFSGVSGAPVASGITADAASAKTPTYGLVRGAIKVVYFNELDGALFDPHVDQRPCGVLDRYEAVGMLIGDCVGLPRMPARPYALRVGREARKKEQAIPAEMWRRRGRERSAEVRMHLRLPLQSSLRR